MSEELIKLEFRVRKVDDMTEWKDLPPLKLTLCESGINSQCRVLVKQPDVTQVRWNKEGIGQGHYYVIARPGKYISEGQDIK